MPSMLIDNKVTTESKVTLISLPGSYAVWIVGNLHLADQARFNQYGGTVLVLPQPVNGFEYCVRRSNACVWTLQGCLLEGEVSTSRRYCGGPCSTMGMVCPAGQTPQCGRGPPPTLSCVRLPHLAAGKAKGGLRQKKETGRK